MRRRKISLRALISAFVAVVFAIAAEPGVMAMPVPQPAQYMMAMASTAETAPCCNHVKPKKDAGTPCKTMAICIGMLSCFGMAAVVAEKATLHSEMAQASLLFVQQSMSGLTLQPDNPPPIA